MPTICSRLSTEQGPAIPPIDFPPTTSGPAFTIAGSLRSGGEGRGAIVNCLLPEHAAHNLALAAELAIQQSPRTVAAPRGDTLPGSENDSSGKKKDRP
ncbi:MAG: hypothetical protein ACKOHG_16610 [Planctomycetia bacterium]